MESDPHTGLMEAVSFPDPASPPASPPVRRAFGCLFWAPVLVLLGCLIEDRWHVVDRVRGPEAPPDPLQASFDDPSEQHAAAIAFAKQSVVNITAQRATRGYTLQDLFNFGPFRFEAPARRSTALGSGFFVTDQGHIVTNAHVIQGAEAIEVVTHDGGKYPATVIGGSRAEDLAVIKIDAQGAITPARWGDSDKVAVGHAVFAIGNPFGFSHSATEGIISALNRRGIGESPDQEFLQTSAAINPGNSGGPLIDRWGRVIGVNTAIYSQSGGDWGIGFAIPSNRARQTVQDIVDQGAHAKPWLGLYLRAVDETLAAQLGLEAGLGVEVAGVVEGGPAHAAGLRPYDVITHWDREAVTLESFRQKMERVKIGAAISLSVLRHGRVLELTLTAGGKTD